MEGIITHVLYIMIITLSVILGTNGYLVKSDAEDEDVGPDSVINELIPKFNLFVDVLGETSTHHHKHKHDMKDILLEHNEVEHLVPVPSTSPPTTAEPTTPQAEHDTLRSWLKAVPRSIFNMHNRMQLATIFLDATSKDDVIDQLAKTQGGEMLHKKRRRGGKRRLVRKKWPAPFHPNVRFKKVNRPNRYRN